MTAETHISLSLFLRIVETSFLHQATLTTRAIDSMRPAHMAHGLKAFFIIYQILYFQHRRFLWGFFAQPRLYLLLIFVKNRPTWNPLRAKKYTRQSFKAGYLGEI